MCVQSMFHAQLDVLDHILCFKQVVLRAINLLVRSGNQDNVLRNGYRTVSCTRASVPADGLKARSACLLALLASMNIGRGLATRTCAC